MAFASAAEAQAMPPRRRSPMSGLLNVIGTVVFTLYNFATRLIGGPPILPANSGGHGAQLDAAHRLRLRWGQGFEVQADWYVPEADEGRPRRTS